MGMAHMLCPCSNSAAAPHNSRRPSKHFSLIMLVQSPIVKETVGNPGDM